MDIKYGTNYSDKLDIVEIAKIFRKEIRDKVKANILPSSYKYRVSCQRFAGGKSIDIYMEVPEKCDQPRYWNETKERYDSYPASVQNAHDILRNMQKSYNFDGSDSSSDYFFVNFYGHVNVREMEK